MPLALFSTTADHYQKQKQLFVLSHVWSQPELNSHVYLTEKNQTNLCKCVWTFNISWMERKNQSKIPLLRKPLLPVKPYYLY